MKTKEASLVVAALMLVVAAWAAWRFGANPEVVESPANASLPAQQPTPVTQRVTPAKPNQTGRPIVSQAVEMPEVTKARVSAEISRLQADLSAKLDTMRAGPRATLKARRDRDKPEDMAFLKSLGLSDELRDKVYDMLTAKADLFWVHEEEILEATRKGERSPTAYISELRQMEADIKAAVGTENYAKLKYWETTGAARLGAAEFKNYLQSRSLPLTEQQEAAVVDAIHQARGRKAGFSLRSPSISMEDKLAYIDTVKQSLAPVLSANEVSLLGQHFKEIAEKPLRMQAANETTQKKITDLQKRVEQMKKANPPALPR